MVITTLFLYVLCVYFLLAFYYCYKRAFAHAVAVVAAGAVVGQRAHARRDDEELGGGGGGRGG